MNFGFKEKPKAVCDFEGTKNGGLRNAPIIDPLY